MARYGSALLTAHLVALNSDGSLYHRFEINGVMSINVVDDKSI